VTFTRKLNGLERMLKFGLGYIVYFLIILIVLGFPVGFSTLLFPCLLISVAILYFGNQLMEVFRKD